MSQSDTSLPLPLKKLHELEFDYDDGEGIDFEPYPEFLTSEETHNWLKAWTGNKEVIDSNFRIFGQDGTGGYAAFWLIHSGQELLEQPIVFFGSEGALGVVASNFQDYLLLLANGIGAYEAIEYFDDLTAKHNAQFAEFAKNYGCRTDLSPEDIIKKANFTHPSFSDYIRSLCC